MHINRKLINGHFLLFNAGIAPLMPYLTTYARQLGFSSVNVGIIFAVLPLVGLLAKPLFSIIADKLKARKELFILFQIIIVITFSAIYLLPSIGRKLTVELDCGNGVSMIKSCFPNPESIKTCKVISPGKETNTSFCKMNCKMSSLRMWETVCEHWGIPQYCYRNTPNIQYLSHISNITVKEKCAYMNVNNVTLDGYNFAPHCRIGGRFGDINRPCSLHCSNQNYSNVLNKEQLFMTCINENLNYRFCVNDTTLITRLLSEPQSSVCEAHCQLDSNSPWQLMEICEGWQADIAQTCKPRMSNDEQFPSNLSFIATIKLQTIIKEHECVFVELKHIKLSDYDAIYYPSCIEKAPYEENATIFHPTCEIDCENQKLNELFHEAQNNYSKSQFTTVFWMFFLLLIINWTGQVVIGTFADTMYLNLIGTKVSLNGNRSLWGCFGWATTSLLTGLLIDFYSNNGELYKDYSVAFILMFIFMTGDVLLSVFIKVEITENSSNIISDIGSLVPSLTFFVFLLWTIVVGLCSGISWQFLFWHIEDIYKFSYKNFHYVKTLQGLVCALQTFFGVLPFMFCSDSVFKKLSHINTMSLVLFSFGVRFVLYSILTNAWWILPIEMFQGITYGIFYLTMMSYATVISPSGKETTVQRLAGAMFDGIGISLGSLFGGLLYDAYGGWNAFQWIGLGSLCCCFLHIVLHCTFSEKITPDGLKQGYSTIIRYKQPNEEVFILKTMENDDDIPDSS